MSNETLPIQYLNYIITKSDHWMTRYMAYPTEEGIQHDGDVTGDHYRYTGNCLYSSHIENLKAEIDEKQPEEPEPLEKLYERGLKLANQSGFGHNLQEEARTYNSMKQDLEAFLMKYVEFVKPGSSVWCHVQELIEECESEAIFLDDRFKERN